MVYRTYERSLSTSVSSVGESMSGTFELPRDRYISELGLAFHIRIANGAGSAQTLTKRQLFSIVDNVNLKVNGVSGNIDVEGARIYDLMSALLGKDLPVIQDGTPIADGSNISIAASSSSDVVFMIPFIFKRDVKNEFDVSGLLDARNTSSLYLNFSTRSGWLPANTNLTITEANSTARVYLKEVVADTQTLLNINQMNGYGKEFYNVYYLQQTDRALSSSTDYSGNIDLIAGTYVHQHIGIHGYDASAADWVNDIIDSVKVKQSGLAGDIDYLEMSLVHSQAEDRFTRGFSNKGFTLWDCDNKLGGLDVRNLKNGDLKLHYKTGGTFASGDLLDVIYKSLIPVKVG